MEKNNLTQKAGANSQQIQADTININMGISEQRAREIFLEEFENSACVRTQEAKQIAEQRVQKLGNVLIPKMSKIEKALDSFADPAFQFVLRDAQKTAAATEREGDFELLSELLVERVNNSTDRKKSLGISKAIEIVDKIDDDALCALTIIYVITKYVPVSGSILGGIDTIVNLYKSVLTCELPIGNEWIEHLEMLNAVKIIPFSSMVKIEEIHKSLDGYICVGIKKESEQYEKAAKLLMDNGVPPQMILVDHELLDGYVRLNINSKDQINEQVNITMGEQSYPLEFPHKTIEAIEQVYEMYSKDKALKMQVEKKYVEKLIKDETMAKIYTWWGSIPYNIQLTKSGSILAFANAQIIRPGIPSIFEEQRR